MKIAVVIPWRKTPSRLRLKNYVAAWYKDNLPEARIIYSDSNHEKFNLSASRNAGAREVLNYDIIIHNDADTIPNLKSLREGIDQTFKTGLFCNPYSSYYTVNSDSTSKVLNGSTTLEKSEYEQVHGACSGVIITTPKTWKAVGGFDENFIGWGYEDVAIFVAHKTIMGSEFLIIPGEVYAMSHAPNKTKGNPELTNLGLELLNQYFEASKDKESMLKLLGDRVI